MLIVDVNSKKVMSHHDFRDANPTISFPETLTPEILAAFGCAFISDGVQPPITDTQTYERDGVVNNNGAWAIQWRVRDLTPAEIEARKPKPLTLTEKLSAAGITID
jgi:hypothetical protein